MTCDLCSLTIYNWYTNTAIGRKLVGSSHLFSVSANKMLLKLLLFL